MQKKKIMAVFGTRPEAIKMAPVIKELKKQHEFEVLVTATAQHREMLDQVLDLFSIKVDYDLDIMKKNQTLSDITIRVLSEIEIILEQEKPDLILVHGDTSSTFVGALASFYHQIEVAHVEAGLRTHNKYSPYPEEINRRLTAVLADIHFAPTRTAAKNLLLENVAEEKIFVTGNTVIDALYDTADKKYNFSDKNLNKIDFKNKKILLLTAHRRENLGKGMENIFRAVLHLTEKYDNVEAVFPVHLNPSVRELSSSILEGKKNIHLIEPLDYLPFVNLMDRSYLILTDSGGIQEEAPSLGKPVLVLRDTTERPEALKARTVIKTGTDYYKIMETASKLIENEDDYKNTCEKMNPYGDGNSAVRISDFLKYYYGYSDKLPDEFESL
ncbi:MULTISPECIES: non-hydrolyzing UDP-N-acetylglucosamine 2-epimerase [unclassified Halanaerobium]|uniref:non-hydrolyzing UDP-N-acetylglucosamine 2-epimerase n=1 Tax=unclassified Halanaerobium TaxID=2641197 RepID=UPI000DF4276C|nr:MULTISPECIES: UDP-N-acetylglucosamine 2-epimerase (non-hydrolyzing) [unclassified Halanaerobium]RCW49866.1 UDP-N-acetylglucosamine 2-epimerase [Halanaerobium sp. MA284_MarDTE_T2]RCW88512.1 UDP-N-acetylglucosamine 2-epimerase [Halanaerobium sp. DL-01]